jgi:hypothetical protein
MTKDLHQGNPRTNQSPSNPAVKDQFEARQVTRRDHREKEACGKN